METTFEPLVTVRVQSLRISTAVGHHCSKQLEFQGMTQSDASAATPGSAFDLMTA